MKCVSLAVPALPLAFLYQNIRSTHLARCSLGTKGTVEEQTVRYRLEKRLRCKTIHNFPHFVPAHVSGILHHAKRRNTFQIHGLHIFLMKRDTQMQI